MEKSKMLGICLMFFVSIYVFNGSCYAQEGAGVEFEGMVYIEGGYYMMGSPGTEPGRIKDEVLHQVKVSPFYMGKYEVTLAEYKEVMGVDIYHERDSRYIKPPDSTDYPNIPAVHVSWHDAVEYCNRRSELEGLRPAYRIEEAADGEGNREVIWDRGSDGYRLPTEAEWEYACRAGSAGPFNMGMDISRGQANYDGSYGYNSNAKGDWRLSSIGTKDVGNYAPSKWGLYDMHGNVWEWCWDWYGEYPLWPQSDPGGPDSGVYRVLRGGSFYNTPQALRSAFRNYIRPTGWDRYTGFRVVRSAIPD
jgi:formylglycine-generating enzyme required for sulfatase activity